jgi:hypothetical protein
VKGIRYLLLMRRENVEEEKLPRLDEALKHNEPLFTGYELRQKYCYPVWEVNEALRDTLCQKPGYRGRNG